MKVTRDELAEHIEHLGDWLYDWERRWDAAVAKRWLADDELRKLEAEGELILSKQTSITNSITRSPSVPQKETVK